LWTGSGAGDRAGCVRVVTERFLSGRTNELENMVIKEVAMGISR